MREKEKVVLSQQQKFHKSQMVAQQLASLASEGGMTEFEERLAVLEKLKGIWSEGKKAIVDVFNVDTGTYSVPIMCTNCTWICRMSLCRCTQ